MARRPAPRTDGQYRVLIAWSVDGARRTGVGKVDDAGEPCCMSVGAGVFTAAAPGGVSDMCVERKVHISTDRLPRKEPVLAVMGSGSGSAGMAE
jgi:hypothetical protein